MTGLTRAREGAEVLEFLERLRALNTAKLRRSEARHKPLLLLYAIGCARRGNTAGVRFRAVEEEVKPLLESSLGVGHRTEVALPFWYLQSDGLWEVIGAEGARRRRGKKIPLTTELHDRNVLGRFTGGFMERLSRDDTLARAACEILLSSYWGKRDAVRLSSDLGLSDLVR